MADPSARLGGVRSPMGDGPPSTAVRTAGIKVLRMEMFQASILSPLKRRPFSGMEMAPCPARRPGRPEFFSEWRSSLLRHVPDPFDGVSPDGDCPMGALGATLPAEFSDRRFRLTRLVNRVY